MNPAPDPLDRLGLRAAGEGIPADNPDRALLLDIASLRAAEQLRRETFNNWIGPARGRRSTYAAAQAAFYAAAEDYDRQRTKVIGKPAQTQNEPLANLRYVIDTDDENCGTQS